MPAREAFAVPCFGRIKRRRPGLERKLMLACLEEPKREIRGVPLIRIGYFTASCTANILLDPLP